MRRSILLFFLFALISARLTAQSYGLGNADPSVFSKYKVPETNLSSLYFNTQLNFKSDKSYGGSKTFIYEYSNNSLMTDFQSSLSPCYYLLMENDDKVFSLDARIEGTYHNAYNKNTNSTNYDSYRKRSESMLNLFLNNNYKNYFLQSDIFYSVNTDIDVNIRDTKEEGTDRQYYYPYEGIKLQNYDIKLGVGWGRIRNVTPVVSAIRFQERLKLLNLINTDLNEKTIEDLAEQFSRQTYYLQFYDRSAKYFWQGIEKTLMDNGVSLSGLNQYGSNYLREVPNEIRFLRNEGFNTGVNLELNYHNSYASADPNKIAEDFFVFGNIYFDYSHQLNLNSQISFNLSLSGGPDLTKNSYYKQKYMINSSLAYNYELTDKIVASISDNISYDHYNFNGQEKYLSNTLGLSLNYFVEDNISLSTSYEFIYTKMKYNYDNTSQNNSRTNNYISVGFTYYIDKGFLFK